MKVLFKLLSSYLLISLVLLSCNTPQKSSVLIAGSQNQWPMSGGPDGSWKVKTDLKVPTKWSVRTGENIKWKTTLPEGGQSGIAVWRDKLFLTINPPNNDAKYSDVLSQFNTAKAAYNLLLNSEIERLTKKGDAGFYAVKKALILPEKEWNAVLEKNKHYQEASAIEKPAIAQNMMRKDKKGKAYSKALESYKSYIHKKSNPLNVAYKSYQKAIQAKKGGASSADIILMCLNSNSGDILWSKTIKGTVSSQYNYGFSDATTPCPITDGKNVWAINASGGMACYSLEGDLVWERTWKPSMGGKPFNKQFDSVLFEDLILNTEPPVEGDTTRHANWNYLHAFNKNTGARIWVTKEALTHYNTPILGETKDGKPAVLIGRGGPHGVPERPVGLSLIGLSGENEGQALWNWEPKEPNEFSGWGALSTQHWDAHKASWFYKGDDHAIINTVSGALISKKPLNVVNQFNFDVSTGKHHLSKNVSLNHHQNQRHCNISEGENLFYMVRYSPFIARHNVITGINEHIEMPQEINEDGSFVWRKDQKNDGLNAKGQLHALDARTRGDGFQKCFLGSPTMINNYIYFTNAIGLVYVVDANAKTFDASAIVAVNDLGKKGETWSVNSLSFANGHIYHRTMKEIICIGNN
ncbi:hypothetical protein GCM10022291_24950 [Postechiella marina]|uniref:Uncharacterized protein n=1 Tax=Postechiella marina TaxID=943941 RepID=A0ABP8CCT7_9FLAO